MSINLPQNSHDLVLNPSKSIEPFCDMASFSGFSWHPQHPILWTCYIHSPPNSILKLLRGKQTPLRVEYVGAKLQYGRYSS